MGGITIGGKGTQSPNMPVADGDRAQQVAQTAAEKQNLIKDQYDNAEVLPVSREFYSNLAESFYCFRNGKKAVFHNGVYATDNQAEIEELEEMCKTKGNYQFFDTPQELFVPDIKILKDVSMASQRVVQGPVNSVGLAGMTPK